MPWYDDIEALRVRAGLDPTDDTKDAQLIMAADTTLSIVETYLDRKLEYMDDSETFYYQEPLLVRRWPMEQGSVTTIFLLDNDIEEPFTISNRMIDYEKGIIYGQRYDVPNRVVIVEYTGGFDPIPNDLLWSLWAVFDAYWAATPGWASSSGGVITGSGEVKKVSLVGIGSVDFDVGTSSAGGDSSSLNADPWGLIPAEIISIIDRYRRESTVGVG